MRFSFLAFHFSFLIVLFSIHFSPVHANTCKQFLSSSAKNLKPLTVPEAQNILFKFAFINPKLESTVNAFEQTQLFTSILVSHQTLAVAYKRKDFVPRHFEILIASTEQAVKNYLSYLVLSRKPLEPHALDKIERLAEAHLEIKRRFVIAKYKDPKDNKNLSRSLVILYRFTLEQEALIKSSLRYLSF